MKKIISLIILLVLVISAIYGCGKTSKGEKQGKDTTKAEDIYCDNHSDDGKNVVGISMPDRLLERWNRDGIFLEAEFKKKGYEVILSFSDNLIDKQINNIRDMIKQGADIIVVSAVDGAALGNVLREAQLANVAIISYDRLLMDTEVVDYYVSFDNYKVGVLQAEYIINALNLEEETKTKTLELVTGDPVDNNARYFYNGAVDTLQPYIDNGKIEIVSGQNDFYETATAQWSTEIAQQRVQIILNSYYTKRELDAILCANDSTAHGAIKALESDYHFDNNVIITGQDGDISTIYNILDGKQSMTVYKTLKNEAVVTVDLAVALLEGKTPGESLISESCWDFSCKYDTTAYNNGHKNVNSYLLEPFAVDATNIEDELFDSGYYRYNSSGLIVVGE